MSAPDETPRVTAIVVSYDTRDDLLRCLASLRDHVRLRLETIVVDNASRDGSPDAVRSGFPDVRLVQNPENRGFSRANNQGLRAARAPYVLILNSDAAVCPGAVEALATLLDERPDIGIVGPRTLSADGTAQVSFGPELTPLREFRQRRVVRGVRERKASALRAIDAASRREHEPAWVSASCFLARRAALEAVGGFDEGFFLYEEDVDLCLRVRRAGWRVVHTPRAEVLHHLGRSMETASDLARLEYQRSHIRYYAKHNGPLTTALLRLLIAAGAALDWAGAMGPGEGRRARRRLARAVLRLTWPAAPPPPAPLA